MWWKWLPWRFVASRAARMHGFLDPITVMTRLQRFAQPSEVTEPIELLRAGVVLHARGLINARVIQHNLDWVWPFWVERQFDPADVAFVPRSFSITHINLTHRNWTALGWPDCPQLAIVDPRGLVTPHLDKWSLDAWIMADDGDFLLPSRAGDVRQTMVSHHIPEIVTESQSDVGSLTCRADVSLQDGLATCNMTIDGDAKGPGWLVVSLRPYNPEGISFVHQMALSDDRLGWQVEGEDAVAFSDPVERHHVSDYRAGDVHIHLQDLGEEGTGRCDIGMVTAAALFRLDNANRREVTVRVPLHGAALPAAVGWDAALHDTCRLTIGDPKIQYLFDTAVRTLVLHSPEDVYPGPYTYKRFWFRDAAFLIHGLLAVGLFDRAARALDRFADRQTAAGYFHSQEGEWDSNGEALWIYRRYCQLSGRPPHADWQQPIRKGADWICRKRQPKSGDAPHRGLLPAGFSAEHLGPNDYYYWDDFWGVAGLEAAADLMARYDNPTEADRLGREAEDFQRAIDTSLAQAAARLRTSAMPAAPTRRMDAGAIGSLAVGYPLQLCPPDDPRLLSTVEYLLANCRVGGGFFQDMIHSGINAYLTLHMAQVLLRAGDPRYLELVDAVADLATPTGQWPEAIHPATRGGCMGDGQHVWAAADWMLMIRNCMVREEGDRLIVGAGVAAAWLASGGVLEFGPAPTAFGKITLRFATEEGGLAASWRAEWHAAAPTIEVRVPGFSPVVPAADVCRVTLAPAP